MKTLQTCVVSVTAVFFAGSIAGCSTEAPEVALPERNINSWVLPMDDYQPMPSIVSNYAERLLDKSCMNRSGYEYPIPEITDLTYVPPVTENNVERRLFYPSIAAEYGYHMAVPTDPLNVGLGPEGSIQLSEEAFTQLNVCSEETYAALPPFELSAQVVTAVYGPMAWDEAILAEPVVESEKAWVACMAVVGVSDLPSTPLGMPSPSIEAEMGGATPSVNEIRVAVADAQCRESTGFRQALYDAEWSAQVTVLEENADELDRARTMNKTYEAALMKAVQERG